MKSKWHNTAFMFLGLITAVTWSDLASAQIATDGHYWKYNGQRLLLLGGWNHGHDPFIDHDTDNGNDSRGVSTPAQIRNSVDDLVAAGVGTSNRNPTEAS